MKNLLLILITLTFIISCKKENNYENDVELCEILKQMTESDQAIRKMELLKNGTDKQKDSLWAIQKKIDDRNTELLIDIIKKKGWPNNDSLECKEPSPVILIFRHSDKKYFETIKKLIDAELEKGNIDGLNHMFIDNHLKGRPDFEFKTVE